jgi:hypothetical protein
LREREGGVEEEEGAGPAAVLSMAERSTCDEAWMGRDPVRREEKHGRVEETNLGWLLDDV